MKLATNDFKKSLGSDNHSGIHPRFLEALTRVNVSHAPAYGTDSVSDQCSQRVKELFGQSVESFFVFNGTAANVLCLKSLIKSHHSVICSLNSHLHNDECGAPEAQLGCKLVTVDTADAKLTPETIKDELVRLGDQHFSQPKMVSLTQPTELGTVYSLEELKAIRELCTANNLYLHIDGARLIHAAHYLKCSLLEAMGQADVVSFGGTKNGLLFGEMVLLFHPDSQKEFKFIRKQAMQLPSKMRFLAAQFLELLGPDELWREISEHGHSLAKYLGQRLEEVPTLKLSQKIQSNAAFVKIPKAMYKALKSHSFFYIFDEKEWVGRWMISFDTQKSDIDSFIEHAKKVNENG